MDLRVQGVHLWDVVPERSSDQFESARNRVIASELAKVEPKRRLRTAGRPDSTGTPSSSGEGALGVPAHECTTTWARAQQALLPSRRRSGVEGVVQHIDFTASGPVSISDKKLRDLIVHFSKHTLRTRIQVPDLSVLPTSTVGSSPTRRKEGREFYTPRSVVRMMVSSSNPRGMRITTLFGSGGCSILSQGVRRGTRRKTRGLALFGQENTRRLVYLEDELLLHASRPDIKNAEHARRAPSHRWCELNAI